MKQIKVSPLIYQQTFMSWVQYVKAFHNVGFNSICRLIPNPPHACSSQMFCSLTHGCNNICSLFRLDFQVEQLVCQPLVLFAAICLIFWTQQCFWLQIPFKNPFDFSSYECCLKTLQSKILTFGNVQHVSSNVLTNVRMARKQMKLAEIQMKNANFTQPPVVLWKTA